MNLKEIFTQLFLRYIADEVYINQCWEDLEGCYTSPTRFYHNLNHLENLLTDFYEVNDFSKSYNAVLFAIFYHDIVYNPGRSDNEVKSATKFMEVIKNTNFDQGILVKTMILESKNHKATGDKIIDTFLDLDIAILGYPEHHYRDYAENIRKEFSHLSNFLFRIGRKKFLKRMLGRSKIFTYSHFYEKYEIQARFNMLNEYNSSI